VPLLQVQPAICALVCSTQKPPLGHEPVHSPPPAGPQAGDVVVVAVVVVVVLDEPHDSHVWDAQSSPPEQNPTHIWGHAEAHVLEETPPAAHAIAGGVNIEPSGHVSTHSTHGQTSVPPQPSFTVPQSKFSQGRGHSVVVVVDVVVVVVVVVVSQTPWSQTSSLVQAETQALLAQVRHWVASQPPQLRVPPQPSEMVPQVPVGQDVAGVQQVPLEIRAPGAQQRPNRVAPCLTVGFAQLREQQLMLV